MNTWLALLGVVIVLWGLLGFLNYKGLNGWYMAHIEPWRTVDPKIARYGGGAICTFIGVMVLWSALS